MNVKNLVLGIGIFIVYLLMLHYGIETFYPSPTYNSFCNASAYGSYAYPAPTEYKCVISSKIQDQADQCRNNGGSVIYQYDNQSCVSGIKECNYCQKQFNDAQAKHSNIVFFIALIAGIITLIIGYGVLSVDPVGSALIASGIGAIFYGSANNWQNLSNIWRFLLLLASLALIIWITLRLNVKKNDKY